MLFAALHRCTSYNGNAIFNGNQSISTVRAELDGSRRTRRFSQDWTVLADRTRRFAQDSTGFAVSSPFWPLRRLIRLYHNGVSSYEPRTKLPCVAVQIKFDSPPLVVKLTCPARSAKQFRQRSCTVYPV